MSMSLRKKNPTQGAVGNLMSRMETLQVSEAAGNTAGDSSKDSKDGGLSRRCNGRYYHRRHFVCRDTRHRDLRRASSEKVANGRKRRPFGVPNF